MKKKALRKAGKKTKAGLPLHPAPKSKNAALLIPSRKTEPVLSVKAEPVAPQKSMLDLWARTLTALSALGGSHWGHLLLLSHPSMRKNGRVPAEITVRSDRPGDVDVRVYDRNNLMVALDESIGPHSFLVFLPPQTGNYKVEIRNLGPGANNSQVKIRELPAGGDVLHR